MKTLWIGAITTLSASTLLAGIPAGRGEITLGASATATYDSNLSGRRGAPGDTYGTLTPRIGYVRKAARIQTDASLSLAIERYLEETQYDTENLAARVSLSLMPSVSEKFSGSVLASYVEDTIVDQDLFERLKTKTTRFSTNANLITGARTSVGASAGYDDSERSSGRSQETYTFGTFFDYSGFLYDTSLRLSYNYYGLTSSGEVINNSGLDQQSHLIMGSVAKKILREAEARFGLGYRYLERSAGETQNGDTSSGGLAVNASIEGPFLPEQYFPKVQSSIGIAYDQATNPGINDTGNKTLSGHLKLDWQARERTGVSFAAIRSQRLSSSDFTVVSNGLELSVNQAIRHNLSGRIFAGYNWDSYQGIDREDKRTTGGGSLNYRFAKRWSATASYRLELIDSTLRDATPERHITFLSVAYSY